MPTAGLIGKSVEIRCLAPDGEPKPMVYWLKNGQHIDKQNKRVLVSHEGSLLINEVRSTDAANYTCVAENLAGKRVSDPALLTVTENKGWSEWSNWTECSSFVSKNCGEGVQKRYRTCLNPPTINNAIGCDGFPHQTITCHVPCANNEPKKIIGHYSEKSHHHQLQPPAQPLNQFQTDEISYLWSQWNSWSMTCNSDCMRLRRRECKPGVYSQSGRFVPLSEDKLFEHLGLFNHKITNKCPGTDIEYSNCTFYCERLTTQFTTLSNLKLNGKYLFSS